MFFFLCFLNDILFHIIEVLTYVSILLQAGNILVDESSAIKLGYFCVSTCMYDTGDRQRSGITFVGTPCQCMFQALNFLFWIVFVDLLSFSSIKSNCEFCVRYIFFKMSLSMNINVYLYCKNNISILLLVICCTGCHLRLWSKFMDMISIEFLILFFYIRKFHARLVLN